MGQIYLGHFLQSLTVILLTSIPQNLYHDLIADWIQTVIAFDDGHFAPCSLDLLEAYSCLMLARLTIVLLLYFFPSCLFFPWRMSIHPKKWQPYYDLSRWNRAQLYIVIFSNIIHFWQESLYPESGTRRFIHYICIWSWDMQKVLILLSRELLK